MQQVNFLAHNNGTSIEETKIEILLEQEKLYFW